jgi:hypothetical protein
MCQCFKKHQNQPTSFGKTCKLLQGRAERESVMSSVLSSFLFCACFYCLHSSRVRVVRTSLCTHPQPTAMESMSCSLIKKESLILKDMPYMLIATWLALKDRMASVSTCATARFMELMLTCVMSIRKIIT